MTTLRHQLGCHWRQLWAASVFCHNVQSASDAVCLRWIRALANEDARQWHPQRLITLALILLLPSICVAAPPTVNSLVPSGGQRGTDVRVVLVGQSDVAGLQFWSDRPGVEFVEADGKEAVKLRISADAAPGVTWLRFFNAEGAASVRPFVIGGWTEVAETEPNNRLGEANPVTLGPTTINGVLQKAGDVDGFAVPLTAGQTLVALLGSRELLGSPMDGLLQIVGPDGFVLEQNDDTEGFDPRIAFTAPKHGTYIVRVFAFPAMPDSSIRYSGGPNYVYRLTLSTGPVIQQASPPAVTLGQSAQLTATGWNLTPETTSLELAAPVPGLQPIVRADAPSTALVYGSSSPVQVEQEPNPRATPNALVVPGLMTGLIGSPRDEDAFRWTAKKDDKLTVRAVARDLGSPLDVVLRLYGPDGTRLQEVDDQEQDVFDATLRATAPADGEYVIAVTDRFAHGGGDYQYVLDAGPPSPHVPLTADPEILIVKSGEPKTWTIAVDRRRSFDDPLTIEVRGLPDGCTAAAVVSEPKGDSSKSVKLTLESTRDAAWSGPVMIVGKTEQGLERTAEAALPGWNRRTQHLWLTILPREPKTP